MALTPEQIKDLKSQLHKQISHLPQEQQKAAQQQIDSLSTEALELMVKQQQGKAPSNPKAEKPIFRKIIDKDIPSAIIDENSSALAVLDILPISQAHAIVIPKKPAKTSKDIPTQALALAKKISKRISKKFKSSSVQILTETKFGETIINILPSYDSPLTLESQRSKATPEQLESIAKKLRPIKKKPVIKLKAAPAGQPLKLPRRIP